MNCGDARFALAADPRNSDPALLEHLEHCAACAAYAGDMHELDRRLRQSLALPVPDEELPAEPVTTAIVVPPSGGGLAGPGTSRGYALAAGIAGEAILVGLLWTGFPRDSLASAVVAHMSHEPDAWTTTASLQPQDVADVLVRSGLRLEPGLPDVTYAQSCWFRGRHVPHLVVRTPDGPVTVLVLPEEHVERAIRIDEDGYRGTLVPARRGSLAVLARDDTGIEGVAERVQAAISYID